MPPLQAERAVGVKTPLKDDVLLFYRMTAKEELGRLFQFDLEMLSEDGKVDTDDVLGKTMTVRLETAGGARRYFNGYVSRFCQAGERGNYFLYQATLHPWLWFLTRTSDCRIYQEKKVPDILKEIFREHGFTDFDDLLSGTYREWEYCVQYRETDFNFVSRLMEQEGIYYYFKHEDGKHKLVLADNYSSHDSVDDYEKIPYYPPDEHERRVRDHINAWTISSEVETGTVALNDFDFERPKTPLLAKSTVKRKHAQADYEMYDYPGEYVQSSDGDTYARARIEEQQARHERLVGSGNARGMAVGALFELEGYHRADQNREYLVCSASHQLHSDLYASVQELTLEHTYESSFEAIVSKQPFRAARTTRKPTVQGPQTAMVVGKSGEEIWTDKYGRVKVQFHWDRYGESDENSSCWIRVAQVWAGKKWGSIHIPRIGQEVIVDFLEGDPDQPIVTGRVYNGESMPPYPLPDKQTQSGVISRSSKSGTAENFNELRFEDKKDSEEIYFHAEKDFHRLVENNDKLEVGLEKKDKGDQTIQIHNNQTLTIGNNKSDDGSQTITIWKDRKSTLETGDETVHIKKGSCTVTIDKGNDSLTVKQGDQIVKISAGKSTTEAAKSIELKVGGSSIKLEPAKITIKSAQIDIKADAKLSAKAPAAEVSGDAMLTLKGGIVQIN